LPEIEIKSSIDARVLQFVVLERGEETKGKKISLLEYVEGGRAREKQLT